MSDTKFMVNKRLTIAIAYVNGNPFVDPTAPTVIEANAMLNISAATRVNGYTFGLKASPQNDDRSFADGATSQIRGFSQFGGDVPFFTPTNFSDTTDILQKAFSIVKTPGVALYVLVRIGPVNSTPFAAGDLVNIYKVNTDGFAYETTGLLGAIEMVTFLPQGMVIPLAILAPAAPVPITVVAPTASTVGKPFWATATYQGYNVTKGVVWTVADATKATSLGGGLFLSLSAGAASITATFPGATASTPTPVTIT